MKTEFVVITLYPGCISFEVALAAELLSRKFRIVVTTPDGSDLPELSGLPLKSQLSYAQVSLEGCRAVLVPGGDPGSIIKNVEIERLLVEANRRGLLVAGICAGPSVLAKAGILKERKIAHGYQQAQLDFLKEIFREVQLTDDAFVADGNILTAKPNAHVRFAVEIALQLGVLDRQQAEKLIEYYR